MIADFGLRNADWEEECERQDAKDAKTGRQEEEIREMMRLCRASPFLGSLGVSSLGVLGVLAFNEFFVIQEKVACEHGCLRASAG